MRSSNFWYVNVALPFVMLAESVQYNLLCPLVSLYRHGQIQAHDPVYLPPINAAQLPECLQPQGDLEKRRNAWHLGSVVAKALVQLQILRTGSLGKGKGKADSKMDKRRTAVAIMANYLVSPNCWSVKLQLTPLRSSE